MIGINVDHKKVDIAGLKINAITKAGLLQEIAARISRKEKTFVVTPYSESLYASLRRSQVRELLNKADFSIADGIGILWAHLFLSRPLTSENFYFNILQAWWQVVWTGAAILSYPRLLYKDIPEKIVGADLAWDLAALAEQHQFSLYILGGWNDTDKIVAKKFQTRFPNLKIVGTSNKNADDPSVISDVTKAQPNMLLVAFYPLVQEQWIATNLPDLPVSFAIALGGTFDYIAGAKRQPPRLIRKVGLEWLYRLITQPSRVKRIFNATWGLVISLVRHKVFLSMPYRPNAVAVVQNSDGKILVVKRNPDDPYLVANGWTEEGSYKFANYWQFPQGGVEAGETLEVASRRELFEEMNVKHLEHLRVSNKTHSYVWQNASRPLFGNIFHYKGQQQHIAYFKFMGKDEDIRPDKIEVVAYQWLALSELQNIVHPEQIDLVQLVQSDLGVELHV